MTGNVDLLLDHLGRFQASLERIECRIDESAVRVGDLEGCQASISRHLGRLAESGQARLLAYDNIAARLERIERRLELTH